jgi:hypothetical protein
MEMMMSDERITIVVDESFGSSIKGQAVYGPIWVVDSQANKGAMKTLWAEARYPSDYLTIFNGSDKTPEESALGILDTIDLHHPGWCSLEVIGVESTVALSAALTEFGEGLIKRTPIGFTFSRKV